MTRSATAYYVGHHPDTGRLYAFRWWRNDPPTAETHPQFSSVIGPFKTRLAAEWAEKYGANNPHFQHVADAERIARQEFLNRRY